MHIYRVTIYSLSDGSELHCLSLELRTINRLKCAFLHLDRNIFFLGVILKFFEVPKVLLRVEAVFDHPILEHRTFGKEILFELVPPPLYLW